jgi:hypothetical protein
MRAAGGFEGWKAEVIRGYNLMKNKKIYGLM